MPSLERENKLPLRLFLRLKDQNIMSDGGPVAMNLVVARSEIAREIDDRNEQEKCLLRILAAHNSMLKMISEKRKDQIGQTRHSLG